MGGGAVPSPASVAAMAAPQAVTPVQPGVAYGYGLFSFSYRDLKLVLHNGDLPGLHSAWVTVPEQGFAVTVLVNGDGHAPLQTALEAVDRLLEPEAAPPTPTPPDPASWAQYEGVYRDPLRPDAFPGALGLDLGDVEVRREGDTLQACFAAFGETLPLTPLGGEFLYLEGTPFSVTFATGAEDGEDCLVVRGLGVARRDDAGETTRASPHHEPEPAHPEHGLPEADASALRPLPDRVIPAWNRACKLNRRTARGRSARLPCCDARRP